jgi:hypothetical protein
MNLQMMKILEVVEDQEEVGDSDLIGYSFIRVSY